jgi:hypothetical protein
MSTTTLPQHEIEIYDRVYRVEVGSRIWPDGWAGTSELQRSDWEGAEFYLPSYHYREIGTVVAVNIQVTGRTLQRHKSSAFRWIRVNIEFVGDGYPSTFSKGWMEATVKEWRN